MAPTAAVLESSPVVQVTDPPPAAVASDLAKLSGELDQKIPPRQSDRNLLIAAWNIREFGNLTEKWQAAPADKPKRGFHAVRCVAEIVSRFDVIAIQEVKENLRALRHMLKVLGPDWGFLLTDVCAGNAGRAEQMAFVFDTRRCRPSGLAGELVVSPEWLAEVGENALHQQFVRTPYAASFVRGGQTFILVTVHIRCGKPPERLPELRAIARWMRQWAEQEREWGYDLARRHQRRPRARPELSGVHLHGLQPPLKLRGLPRTIFPAGSKAFYDQIAWFGAGTDLPVLSLQYTGKAGNFDFVPLVMAGLDREELSWRMSDHYPLWVEFSTRTD